jgi:hypothetical protein
MQGILHTEDENKQNHKGPEVSNHWRRKDKYAKSRIELAVKNQILKQQKQLNGRNHHIPIHINSEY